MHRERSTASSQEQKTPHASQVSLSITNGLQTLTNTIMRPLRVVHHECPEYPHFPPPYKSYISAGTGTVS